MGLCLSHKFFILFMVQQGKSLALTVRQQTLIEAFVLNRLQDV
jgi:hypothetical protein